MSNQQKLQDEDLLSAAKQVGIADIAAWQSCLSDPEQVKEVMKDQQDGAKAGVTGTPAFFVNGIFLNGAQRLEEFNHHRSRARGLSRTELLQHPGFMTEHFTIAQASSLRTFVSAIGFSADDLDRLLLQRALRLNDQELVDPETELPAGQRVTLLHITPWK